MNKPAKHAKAVSNRRPHNPPKQAPGHKRRLPVLQEGKGGGGEGESAQLRIHWQK